MATLSPIVQRAERALRGLLYGLVVAAAVGCANVDTSAQLEPAELGTVAVFPFGGDHGRLLADRVHYELLKGGVTVVARTRVTAAVKQAGLTPEELTPGHAGAERRLKELAATLGADTAVAGSVVASEREETLANRISDELRRAMPFKVASASAHFIRSADGTTLAVAEYRPGRNLPFAQPTHHDAAESLVATVLGR